MRRRPARTKRTRTHLWMWLIGFVLLLLIAFVWKQWSTSVFMTRDWRVNILLNSDPLTVISFPKAASDRLVLVTIPEEAYLTVPWGYGPYRVGAIAKLAEQENKPYLFGDGVSDLFGLQIHGVWSTGEALRLSEQSLIEDIKFHVSLSSMWSTDMNGLNLFDKWSLYWKLKNWPVREVKTLTTRTTDRLFVDRILPDGTEIKEADSEFMTRFFERTFEEASIRRQSLSVTVVNTTDTQGLGQQFARFLTTVGGDVIQLATEDADADISHCSIEVSQSVEQSILVSYIEKEFACTKTISDSVEGADVVVRVGDDFGERWVR